MCALYVCLHVCLDLAAAVSGLASVCSHSDSSVVVGDWVECAQFGGIVVAIQAGGSVYEIRNVVMEHGELCGEFLLVDSSTVEVPERLRYACLCVMCAPCFVAVYCIGFVRVCMIYLAACLHVFMYTYYISQL